MDPDSAPIITMGQIIGFCVVVHCVLVGALASWLAKQKGRDELGWFVAGALFSIIGLIAIAGALPLEPGNDDDQLDSSSESIMPEEPESPGEEHL